MNNETILFFDGVCGLCNRVVDFLIQRDKRHHLKFSPLQGNTAKKALPANLTSKDEYATVVLWDKGDLYLKSTAALKAIELTGGVWGFMAKLGFVFPRFFRDMVYDIIATNRYQIFGKKEACRIPTKEERQFFLD